MSIIQSVVPSANEGTKKLLELYGPKYDLSTEQLTTFYDLLDGIEEFAVNQIRPNAPDWDRIGAKLVDGKVVLPGNMESMLNELIKDNELYTIFIPEKYGGYGYPGLFQASFSELLSQFDLSYQILSTISFSVIEAIINYYKEEFQPVLEGFMRGDHTGFVGFTEPQAGSNLEKIKTTSELDGNEYVINGTKIFISNGGYADTGLVLAKNMVNGKQEGTNVFLVEGLEGITTLRLEEKSGLHGNPTAQLLLEDVRVPKENVIAEVGDGYRKVLERLMGMRVGVSMQSIGASERALQLAKAYANEREQFGKPIISFDGISRKIHEMEKQIPRMKTYAYMGAYALDRYYRGWIPTDIGASGDASEKTAAEMVPSAVRAGLAHYQISAAKIYAPEISNYMVYDAQQIFGGNGFVAEYEINKIARDLRVTVVYEGTSEIHEWLVSRAQQAVQMLPKFQKVSESYEDTTVYERILYEKFPLIKGKI